MIKLSHNIVNILYFQTTFEKELEPTKLLKINKNLEGGLSMGIYSIRVRYDRSLLVGKCVNALEQRLTIVLISLDTVSSFKFPQGPIYFKPLWGGGGLFTTKIMTPILHRELEYKVCVGHAAEACE